MQDLVTRAVIKPGPPALGAQNLTHWTTREVLETVFLNDGMICWQECKETEYCLYWEHS